MTESKKAKIKSTPLLRVFLEFEKSDKKLLVLQGGAGSSKTYTTLQWIIIRCLGEWNNKTIDITRRTMPAHKQGAIKDFLDIIKELGLFKENNYNRTDQIYRLGSNLIRFFSADDEKKMRGPRRHIAYHNEVLEMKKMDVMQILMRTQGKTIMDYNPSEEFSWIYDEIIPRDDVMFHKSTFLDNPFISSSERDEICRLEKTDSNLWRIYGLGEKGLAQATIFSNWDYANKTFSEYEGMMKLGLDLGFNDPCVLVQMKHHEETKTLYVEELFRGTQLTSKDLVLELDKLVKKDYFTKDDEMYCDNNRPEIIEDLRRHGYNARSVKKGEDSVRKGINYMKQHEVHICKNSVELIKEYRGYKWQTNKDDKVLDKPVKHHDHGVDAIRYALERSMRGGVHVGVIGGRSRRRRR